MMMVAFGGFVGRGQSWWRARLTCHLTYLRLIIPRVGSPPSDGVETLKQELDRVAPVVVSGLRGKNRAPVQQSDARS
jgi:hypothetical protein